MYIFALIGTVLYSYIYVFEKKFVTEFLAIDTMDISHIAQCTSDTLLLSDNVHEVLVSTILGILIHGPHQDHTRTTPIQKKSSL